AVHLAGCLVKKGSVIVIDGDLNRSALEWNERGEGLPYTVISLDQTIKQRGHHDFTIVDTMARPDRKKLAALVESSDTVILTTSPDALSIAASELAITDLDYLKAKFSILITMVPPLSTIGDSLVKHFKDRNLSVLNTVIRRYAAFQKAANLGCLVCDVSDDYAVEGWHDYQSVTKELVT
ncbi:MAG: ParA family protein, partial [Candidatus Saccharimonadales bacterium]